MWNNHILHVSIYFWATSSTTCEDIDRPNRRDRSHLTSFFRWEQVFHRSVSTCSVDTLLWTHKLHFYGSWPTGIPEGRLGFSPYTTFYIPTGISCIAMGRPVTRCLCVCRNQVSCGRLPWLSLSDLPWYAPVHMSPNWFQPRRDLFHLSRRRRLRLSFPCTTYKHEISLKSPKKLKTHIHQDKSRLKVKVFHYNTRILSRVCVVNWIKDKKKSNDVYKQRERDRLGHIFFLIKNLKIKDHPSKKNWKK